MDLENAWVVLTGASRGIGVTIAEEFAKKGANLVLVARSMEGLEKTCDRVKQLGGTAVPIAFDLHHISEIKNLVEEIKKAAPHTDVLVNNAGLEKYCFFQDCATEDITSILSVNLIAPMELTRLLLPDMLERKKGHIINIGSLAGKIGETYNSLYATSKGGIDIWTDALRQELYKTGIKVTIVAPGGITDAGMIYNIGIPYPAVIGSCTSEDVAKATIRCITKYKSKVFVNSLPVKPLIMTNLVFPSVFDAFFRWSGLAGRNKEKVYRRKKKDLEK
jgi:short-subunit dehydrogenase